MKNSFYSPQNEDGFPFHKASEDFSAEARRRTSFTASKVQVMSGESFSGGKSEKVEDQTTDASDETAYGETL